MGDPKKQQMRYQKPRHRWEKGRIEEESNLLKEYGLKNKSEIWRTYAILTELRLQAKRLTRIRTEQSEREKKLFLTKMVRLGLLPSNAGLGDVLNLQMRDILERRLQTLLFRKGLAHSAKQARQFIVHRHVNIGEKAMTVPSYLVRSDEEPMIQFAGRSPLSDDSHPERAAKPTVKPVVEKQHKHTEKTEKAEEAKTE